MPLSIVPPFKLSGTASIVPRFTTITSIFGNTQGFSLSVGGISASTGQLDVICGSSSTIGNIIRGAASQSADLTQWQDSSTNILTSLDQNGFIVFLKSSKTFNAGFSLISSAATTQTISASTSFQQLLFQHTYLFSATQGFVVNYGLRNAATYINSTSLSGGSLGVIHCAFINNETITADTNTFTASAINSGFYDNPSFTRVNGGTLTIPEWDSFVSSPVNNTGVTVTLRRGLLVNDISAGSTTTNIGVDIVAQTGGTSLIAGVRCATASGTAKWFLYETGTADNSLAGNLRLGDNTAPTSLLDLSGKLTATSSGIVTKYNNIATVSNGVPSELATVDLTAQGAAVGSTTIYTPAATGMFRVSIYLQVTRAATTSSVLGGATGVVVTYNDGDGNVAQSDTAALATTAGAIAITSAGNTTATNLTGSMVIYARTGVAIQYAIGYTSVGLTSMQYAAHLKIEAL